MAPLQLHVVGVSETTLGRGKSLSKIEIGEVGLILAFQFQFVFSFFFFSSVWNNNEN